MAIGIVLQKRNVDEGATASRTQRETIHRAFLSGETHPNLRTLGVVPAAIGLKIQIRPKGRSSRTVGPLGIYSPVGGSTDRNQSAHFPLESDSVAELRRVWSLRFAEPIVLEDGTRLASLREAIAHLVNTTPAAERGSPAVPDGRRASDQRGRTWRLRQVSASPRLQALNRRVECTTKPRGQGTRHGAAASQSRTRHESPSVRPAHT
jgi:hypothetical protein